MANDEVADTDNNEFTQQFCSWQYLKLQAAGCRGNDRSVCNFGFVFIDVTQSIRNFADFPAVGSMSQTPAASISKRN
jgi:hypothetical protein